MSRLARILGIIGAAGVELRLGSDCATAYACVERSRYVIAAGRIWATATDEQRATLLAHELAHVLRGDLEAIKARDVDVRVYNVASDAHINHGLPPAEIAALQGVTYEALRESRPDLPPALPGTRRLHDLLRQGGDGDGGDEGGESEGGGEGEHLRRGDGSSVDEATRAATVLRARAAAQAAGIDPGEIGASVRVSAPPPPVAVEPWTPPPRLAALLAAIEAAAAGARGALVRTRSYSRPGRVPGLRGVLRSPRLRVLLALDASGSMSEWAPHAQSAARALRRSVDADVAAWADRAALWPAGAPQPDVGYGTDPAALVPLARRYDATVVVTDGEFDRAAAAALEAAARVVWLITKGGRADHVSGRVVHERAP